jgi:hypothetical protein
METFKLSANFINKLLNFNQLKANSRYNNQSPNFRKLKNSLIMKKTSMDLKRRKKRECRSDREECSEDQQQINLFS